MVKLRYSKFYLVGIREERTSTYRVVDRDGVKKPEYVCFSGNYPMLIDETTYGVLVLDDEMWERFSGKVTLPGMGSPKEAAETLIKQPNIFFGCPFCVFRCKEYNEYVAHVEEHATKIFSNFDTVEEKEPTKRGRKKNGENECRQSERGESLASQDSGAVGL